MAALPRLGKITGHMTRAGYGYGSSRARVRAVNLSPMQNPRLRTRVGVMCGLCVLREQLFLRLLLTTCRASEYTLDLESCLGTLRQS
jgi:hypothetical protein